VKLFGSWRKGKEEGALGGGVLHRNIHLDTSPVGWILSVTRENSIEKRVEKNKNW